MTISLDVECPTCGAFQDQPCVSVRRRPIGSLRVIGSPLVASHAARRRLAAAVAVLTAAHPEDRPNP